MSAKSNFLAYFFWLLGGWLGLHHFYLGRDLHALIWLILPGGYFGLGWLRDFWRIPEYVKEANQDKSYLAELNEEKRRNEQPPSGTIRLFGQMIVADILGYMVLWAIPAEFLPEWMLPWCASLVPLSVALGVWLVGNVGHHKGSLRWALLGAYATYPLYFFSLNNIFWTATLSSTLFNWYGKEWRSEPYVQNKSLKRRISYLAFWLSLYLLLVSSALYFSCEFTDNNGDQVKCRDAIHNFFTSPMWQEFKTVMADIYEFAKSNGWSEVWKQLLDALDPQGEANALRTLNLTSDASEEQIRSTYRKLARQWHPDRFKPIEEKERAQDKFIEIQKAYETLSNIKSKRLQKNKESREGPETEYTTAREEL